MKQNPNIDELLNGFIDEELTTRQHTEVKRLIKNDAQIAKRLKELQKCKMLVGSLPRAEAPADMVEEIKYSLERRSLLAQQPEHVSHRIGVRHLLARKALTAAAMIALIAVLASVIYTIIAPESTSDTTSTVYRPQVSEALPPKPTPIIATTVETSVAKDDRLDGIFAFNGRLELKTNNLIAVDKFIHSAIKNNDLSEKVDLKSQGRKSMYTFSCSRETLSSLLADLENIWDKFDSAVFSVETDRFGEQIVVNAVTAEQTIKIVEQADFKNNIQVARDFAVLNNITERLPGEQILGTTIDTKKSLITIPKPRLTSDEKEIKKSASQEVSEQNVCLTIVVGSE